MRNRMVSLTVMVVLVGVTLLGAVGASDSGGTFPGQAASAELMEGTTARYLGMCINSGTACTVTSRGGTYCSTNFGAGGGGGCTPNTGAARGCGNCTGGNHIACVANSFVATRCCTWTDKCCQAGTVCTTNAAGTGCNCVVNGPAPAPYGAKYACYTGAGPVPAGCSY